MTINPQSRQRPLATCWTFPSELLPTHCGRRASFRLIRALSSYREILSLAFTAQNRVDCVRKPLVRALAPLVAGSCHKFCCGRPADG